MTTKEYQSELTKSLTTYFDDLEVKSEWAAFKRGRLQYSPRVDIAIGPFNTVGPNITREYSRMVRSQKVRSLINEFYQAHRKNIKDHFDKSADIPLLNRIPQRNRYNRCLLTIEIANENSKKHIMGGLLNAASLGRVGVGIAFSERYYY